MPDSGSDPGVPVRIEGGDTTPDVIPAMLREVLDGGDGHALRPLTREGKNRVPVAERAQRFTNNQQRLFLDVDNPLAAGNPAVGRRADIDEQRQGELAASG